MLGRLGDPVSLLNVMSVSLEGVVRFMPEGYLNDLVVWVVPALSMESWMNWLVWSFGLRRIPCRRFWAESEDSSWA